MILFPDGPSSHVDRFQARSLAGGEEAESNPRPREGKGDLGERRLEQEGKPPTRMVPSRALPVPKTPSKPPKHEIHKFDEQPTWLPKTPLARWKSTWRDVDDELAGLLWLVGLHAAEVLDDEKCPSSSQAPTGFGIELAPVDAVPAA